MIYEKLNLKFNLSYLKLDLFERCSNLSKMEADLLDKLIKM